MLYLMRIQLSDHFTYGRIFRFVMPPICMMLFTSVYGIVDGLFVSNFVGKTPFAAINLIMPYLMTLCAFGYMFGAGGSAIIGKTLGEQKPDKANEYFSMLVYVAIALGIGLTIIGIAFMRPVAMFFGAEGELLEDCVLYGNISMISMTPYLLMSMFESLFITAEKPKLGFWVNVIAGSIHILLDAVFIIGFHWGLLGAATATVISEFFGGSIPLFYFFRRNDSLLRLGKTHFYGRVLGKTCVNGLSEMASTLSVSFVSMLFNFQLMRLTGENGVAAYGVMMYVNFIFMAVFFGYSMGIAPVISYHFGAKNHAELKNLFTKSIRIMALADFALTALALIISVPICKLFVGYDPALYALTLHGYIIVAFSFLMIGYTYFGSYFFTALNNGVVSAIISLLRLFVFRSAAVLTLPIFFGTDGVWLSMVSAELLSTIIVTLFLYAYKDRYHYL